MRRGVRAHLKYLRELGAADRKHRCAICLQPLAWPVFQIQRDDRTFCSDGCRQTAQAREQEDAK